MGSGRFGNENYSSLLLFSSSLISFIYVYDLLKLFLYNLIMMCVAARAYLLGYNCADEKELEAALRFCWTHYGSLSLSLCVISGCLYLACSEMTVNVNFLLFGYWRLLGTMMFMHLVITQVLDYITGSIVIVIALVVVLLLHKLILDLQVGMSIYLIVDGLFAGRPT